MLVTIAELIIICLIVDALFRRISMPGLIGMLLAGVFLGPHAMNVLDPRLVEMSAELRMVALIVILLRAGLELSRRVLHRVGGRAILLATVPAVFEATAITAISPKLLGLSYLEGAILGTIISAVSPAVVITLMVRFIEKGLGARKSIPELMLSACSINDVFVIVIFSALLGAYTGQQFSVGWKLAGIPLSIILGAGLGVSAGVLLCRIFDCFNPRATKRVLMLLAVSVIFVRLEHALEGIAPFAALLAVMASGFIILEKNPTAAHEISARLAKLWVVAEIVLFSMVGAQVDVNLTFDGGGAGLLLIMIGLLARGLGTYVCMWQSGFTVSEKLFLVVSYCPKATVQAAIGGIPLTMMLANGLDPRPGNVILSISVLSIAATAPLGAWAIEFVGNRVLEPSSELDAEAHEAIVESDAESETLI